MSHLVPGCSRSDAGRAISVPRSPPPSPRARSSRGTCNRRCSSTLAGGCRGFDHASAVQLDAAGLPFADATFDAVLVVLMLGEVPERARCLSECRRVLRPGGVALFAESRRDSDFIGRADLRALVEPHGFELDRYGGRSWEYTARFRAIPDVPIRRSPRDP